MTSADQPRPSRRDIVDLAGWTALCAVGVVIVLFGARRVLHTDAAPFLGVYQLRLGPWLLGAAALSAAVLLASGWVGADPPRMRFGVLQVACYVVALCWAVTLSAGAGLGSRLADTGAVSGHPMRYLAVFTDRFATHAQGRPPGPGLLLWLLHRAGLTGPVPVALAVTAIGALAVPLVLATVRNSCGEVSARRFAPLLVLAPYAAFLAGSMDGVAAALGAGMALAGARASDTRRSGRSATGWALLAGLLLGVAAMFSYAAPWLGLSVVFLNFARRRPFLNVATGLGALVVPLAGAAAGFSWLSGLFAAHAGYVTQPASALLWGPVSLVTLLLCCGPALVASLHRLRNTPGWPFLAGSGLAVTFSVLAGFARGGAETSWLPFFAWLTIAATAPDRQAGPPVATPRLLAAAGAVTALAIAALVTPTV